MTIFSIVDKDEDDECGCEYPHSSDFDPNNFEICSCKDKCWHFPYSLESILESVKESR